MIHLIVKPNFSYTALEPYIDAVTMEIHTEKHHQTYADKLNALVAKYPELENLTLPDFFHSNFLSSDLPDFQTIRNMAGGVANHNFFWTILSPDIDQPVPDSVSAAINLSFGSFEAFKTEFATKASTLFGSGWTWLVKGSPRSTHDSRLNIINLPNQDSPLSQNLSPILGLDVWEHAYYLKYQNRRPDYIEAFWHVINWEQVNQYYQQS